MTTEIGIFEYVEYEHVLHARAHARPAHVHASDRVRFAFLRAHIIQLERSQISYRACTARGRLYAAVHRVTVCNSLATEDIGQPERRSREFALCLSLDAQTADSPRASITIDHEHH
eukprot:COSAG02_NODE_112_length_35994_cov_12.152695_26_plen_116_part_00